MNKYEKENPKHLGTFLLSIESIFKFCQTLDFKCQIFLIFYLFLVFTKLFSQQAHEVNLKFNNRR